MTIFYHISTWMRSHRLQRELINHPAKPPNCLPFNDEEAPQLPALAHTGGRFIEELHQDDSANTPRSSIDTLVDIFEPGRGNGSVGSLDTLVDTAEPDGGYGWVVVACVLLLNMHNWGLNASYGVFLAHFIAHDTYPGATYLQYAFIGGLSIGMTGVSSPLATIVIRKYGSKTSVIIGVLLEFVALLGASWSTQIWQLFLSQGICWGLGNGFLFSVSIAVVPQWFSRHRSFANSIGSTGSGIGGLVYSLAANALIQKCGVSWAYRILALIAFTVNAACAILIKDRNDVIQTVHEHFSSKLLRRYEVLLLLGWSFFSLMGYVILLFSLPDYCQSIGLSAQQGSVISALINLGQIIGRPLVGFLSDRFGRMRIAFLATCLISLFCFLIWPFAKNYGGMVVFSLLVGMVVGTFWSTVAPVLTEVVGLKLLPSALSIVLIVLIIPTTFAEPVALAIRLVGDSSNVYIHTQIFTACIFVGAAICIGVVSCKF